MSVFLFFDEPTRVLLISDARPAPNCNTSGRHEPVTFPDQCYVMQMISIVAQKIRRHFNECILRRHAPVCLAPRLAFLVFRMQCLCELAVRDHWTDKELTWIRPSDVQEV